MIDIEVSEEVVVVPTITGEATVLIVDDEPISRQLMAHMLRPIDVTVIEAGSGQEAIETSNRQPPDVILCDILMPGMDGFDLSRRLKASTVTRHIPIVLITALQGTDNLAKGLDSGADDYLSKPVTGLELRARVRSMLRIKRQYDDILAALQLREDLAHMIAHDLRNPLTALTYLGDLLLATGEDRSPEEIELVQQMSVQTSRVNRMLTDLLLLAKAEKGRLLVTRSIEDPAEVVRDAVDNHRSLAGQRDIELRCEVEPDAPAGVALDRNLFLRLLDNLVANAVKFSPRGGEVAVRVCSNRVTQAGPGGGRGLRVEVADAGPGIAEEHRGTVFEKFGVVALRKRVQQVGLGLPFARLVAEAHGGIIWVEDNQPVGSIFVVELPGESLTSDIR